MPSPRMGAQHLHPWEIRKKSMEHVSLPLPPHHAVVIKDQDRSYPQSPTHLRQKDCNLNRP